MLEADPLYCDLPFRIRIGVIGAASLPEAELIAPTVRRVLSHVIRDSLTPESRAVVEARSLRRSYTGSSECSTAMWAVWWRRRCEVNRTVRLPLEACRAGAKGK